MFTALLQFLISLQTVVGFVCLGIFFKPGSQEFCDPKSLLLLQENDALLFL